MDETMNITNLFLKNIDNNFKLDLKLHPINVHKKIKIKKLKIISNNNLNEIIKNYKFIICSNSTTSIYEVLKNKKIPFVYLNKNNLNLCPIKQMKNINYITSDLSVRRLIKNKYKKILILKSFQKYIYKKEANLVILNSGGTTPVINSTIYGCIDQAKKSKLFDNIFISLFGVDGLILNKFLNVKKLKINKIKKLKFTPGSAFGISRNPRISKINFEKNK